MSAAIRAKARVDERALLSQIGGRLVRRVAAEVSPFAEALYAVVLERRPAGQAWTEAEWQAVLDELDNSELTIASFLELEHQRSRGA